jgi:predicted Zn finger-like uncharacterized protein
MIIVCPACQARYKFDEAKLGNRPRARSKCAKCGGAIEIENPALGSMTLPPSPAPFVPPVPVAGQTPLPGEKTEKRRRDDPGGQTVTGMEAHKVNLELPKDRRFSLAIIQGPATGHIHQITTTRTTIGRSGADINLDDPEASRQHAALDVFGDQAILRDMGSTNGTYVDGERVQQRDLQNQMEFRIGSHVLMFIVTGVD